MVGQSQLVERLIEMPSDSNTVSNTISNNISDTRLKIIHSKKDYLVTEAIAKLYRTNFSEFKFLGRLGYDVILNVSYFTQELHALANDSKIVSVKHFSYAQGIHPRDISAMLHTLFDEFNAEKGLCSNTSVCSEYAIAVQKILEAPINREDSTMRNNLYFILAKPNKSSSGINGNNVNTFESSELRVFLLKYNPERSH